MSGAEDAPRSWLQGSLRTPTGFANPPGLPEENRKTRDWAAFAFSRLGRGMISRVPTGLVLPRAQALATLREAVEQPGDFLTWLGHSSFLLRLDGVTVLLDPFLSGWASPLPPLGPRRLSPPGLTRRDLPKLDAVLVSHNHYDHCDAPTLRRLARSQPGLTGVVPLGLGPLLKRWGFGTVAELDWGESLTLGPLAITATPALHFSARSLKDRNRTLWCGFALATPGRRLYFAGDTAYAAAVPVFREVGEKLGPFDAALVPIGAYAPRALMLPHHTNPEEAVTLAVEVQAKEAIAMHWGALVLTTESLKDPPRRFLAAAQAASLPGTLMRIGETRRFS